MLRSFAGNRYNKGNLAVFRGSRVVSEEILCILPFVPTRSKNVPANYANWSSDLVTAPTALRSGMAQSSRTAAGHGSTLSTSLTRAKICPPPAFNGILHLPAYHCVLSSQRSLQPSFALVLAGDESNWKALTTACSCVVFKRRFSQAEHYPEK